MAQLPRVMAQDDVVRGFVLALEEVADSVRERVRGIDSHVDVDLASPEMLQFVGAWLGVDLEPSESGQRQRELVRAVGRTLGWRGTRHGVETVLAAATGSRVTVTDSGGVFGPDDTLPPLDPEVVVSLDTTGTLTEGQVRAVLADEVPVGCVVRLEVRYPDADGASL